jgi:hypothetical protein
VALASPATLAAGVRKALEANKSVVPSLATLERLFETMFAASVHTEEGEPIAFHIAYMNPADPDPEAPPRIRRDRWLVWPLDTPLPFDIPSLVKLSKASDPRSSSLAVYRIEGKLRIWGLIDQGTHYFDYMNYDSESAQAARPGLFQASIEGVAHVVAWLDYYKIAELRGTALVGASIDALSDGVLFERLIPSLDALLTSTEDEMHAPIEDPGVVMGRVYETLMGALRRILLRARSYRHGGALLIMPAAETQALNIKYEFRYSRLCDAMKHKVAQELEERHATREIMSEVDSGVESISAGLYLAESVATDELADIAREVNSAVWFISLLTRIDGLVLLDTDMCVRGFGVEITASEPPQAVYKARSPNAKQLSEIDYNHYGTRHRSMMRLCAAIDGSVGFVISQDGAIRAMTSWEGGVVMWDDLMVQRLKSAPADLRVGWGKARPARASTGRADKRSAGGRAKQKVASK